MVFRDIDWLRKEGVRIWYDEGIPGGKIWTNEIAAAIENAFVIADI